MVDSAKGYVLTNQHVVGSAHTVDVLLYDGRQLFGQVLVTDSSRDIALLKVSGAMGVPALSFATAVQEGDPVVALGFPLGELLGTKLTITRGIVSSLRTYGGVDYIQTDTAVNPGNSGGPLLNLGGKVVGMNTFGVRDTEGINFAIKYNVLSDRLPTMIAQAEAPATPTPTRAAGYGPVNGSIAHEPDSGFIDVFETDVWITNGIVQATFFNPYPHSVGEWSNGFLFRRSGFDTFHAIYIRSNGNWWHDLRLGSVEETQYLAFDYSPHIAIGEGEHNVITVVFNGSEGLLYVNEQEVAKLDLSGLVEPGSVSVVAAYYSVDGVAGYSTRFENFAIRPLD